jgi:hypothetical protein
MHTLEENSPENSKYMTSMSVALALLLSYMTP